MRITNKYNLPNGLFNALKEMSYVSEDYNQISVSSLVSPPLIWYLRKKYDEQIEEDASQRLWALLGSSVHYIIEKAENKNITEEKMSIEVDGVKIVGRFDVYTEDKEIIDYKITSVYSFLLGEKEEWTNQLNVYAYMLRTIGFDVEHAYIYAILRDWKERDALKDEDYPPIPFIQVEVNLWPFEEQERYVKERVYLFKRIQQEPLENFICSDKERWKRGGEIALKQKGRERAIKIFKDGVPSNLVLSENQYLEERPVEFMRCQKYCVVRNVCPWGVKNGD
ncbi:MAG: hypothetical protein QXF86_03140 [Candidatus Bilamarchaeaceae archaeon]